MYDLNYTILQLGSVYGPNSNKKNLITRLIVESINNGAMEHHGNGMNYVNIYILKMSLKHLSNL